MENGSKIYSLQALTGDPLATRNSILFAALCACGIPPEISLCGEYVEVVNGSPRSVTVWRLKDQSLDGRYKTADLIKFWGDPQFVTEQPDHPLAYLKAGFENHTRAVAFIKDQGPIAIRRRGKKVALITNHTSPDRRKRIIDELNR